MDDLISRQAAIDALCRRCDLAADDDEPCTEKCNDIKILEKLPSADTLNLQPTCNQLATDCISRHAVSAWLDNMGCPKFADVVMDENRFPSAQPRMKGKWVKGINENGVTTSLFCSECNYENKHWYEWNFCPNCGADMRGEQDERPD